MPSCLGGEKCSGGEKPQQELKKGEFEAGARFDKNTPATIPVSFGSGEGNLFAHS